MKKESLSIIFVKTLLAVLLFAGIGTIIIGGGYIIGEYSKNKVSDQIVKPIDPELEKYCAGDSCCLASLRIMRENNYEEAYNNEKCPEGYRMNSLRCITSYSWCEPMEEIDWKSCDQDSDCVEAQADCCGCANGGEQIGINKKYLKNWEDILKNKCQDVGCITLFSCKEGSVICENNKCEFKEEINNDDQPNTSNWQTYRNEEFGFEVKYPEDFTKQETVSDNSLLYLKKAENGSNIFMNINIKRNYQVNYFETEEIKIGDRIGYKYFYQEGVGYSGVVLIQLGQDALELAYDFIGYYKDEKISKESFVENNFNQILSTFKFMEK